MFCKSCGIKNLDNAKFCGKCGADISGTTATAASDVQVPNNLDNPDNTVTQITASTVALVKSKPQLKILIALVAGLVLISIIAGVFISSVKSSPLNALGLSLTNTVDKGNFDFKLTVKHGGSSETVKGSVKANLGKKEMMFDVEMDNYRYALYKNEFMIIYKDSLSYSYSIEDELNEIYKAYKEHGSKVKDIDSLDIESLMEEYSDTAGFDMEYIEDYVDFKKLNKALKDMVNKLNDEKYLADNFGFSKEKADGGGTKYSFSVSTNDAAEEFVKIFSSAIPELEDIGSSMFSDDKVRFSYTVNKDYITAAEIRYSDYWSGDVRLNLELSNIGKTSLNEKELKEFYEDA